MIQHRVGNVVLSSAECRDATTRATCKLRAVADRKDIVAFTVHGTRKVNATCVVQGDIIAVTA